MELSALSCGMYIKSQNQKNLVKFELGLVLQVFHFIFTSPAFFSFIVRVNGVN